MLRISEIMTPDVLTLTPQTSLRDAVELFSARHISGAPVVSGQEVVGVVSAADIIGFAAGALGSAVQSLDEPPQTESGVPGSYYTDLFCEDTSDVVDRMSAAENPSWDLLDEHTVDEVMTRVPITLGPNASVIAAAELMRAKSIHRVLVIDKGKIVGIVSALDVARAVAEHKVTVRASAANKTT